LLENSFEWCYHVFEKNTTDIMCFSGKDEYSCTGIHLPGGKRIERERLQ